MMAVKGVEQESDYDVFEVEEFTNVAPEIAELFDLTVASFGFAGKSILKKLAAGEPLAVVADIPDELFELLYGRAHLWVQAGHVQRAEQIFQALCMANPQDPDYWAGFGLCLTKRGAWDRGLQAYDRALEMKPDWRAIHVYCLEACVHMKDWDRAFEHSRLVREFSRDLPEDLLELAARFQNLIADRFGDISGGSSS